LINSDISFILKKLTTKDSKIKTEKFLACNPFDKPGRGFYHGSSKYAPFFGRKQLIFWIP
jgi:hypothetical protein